MSLRDLRANCKDGSIMLLGVLYVGTFHVADSNGLFYLGGAALLFDFLAGVVKPDAFSWPLLFIGLVAFIFGTLDLLAA